ncbi:hypothetical protein MM817_01269 [Acidibacillus sp. S0AB]|uniref:DUF4359 domain-containing protein n=1 Tax=Sulfoacidibacillus ferrooxidans TaxID=2005001 RepID=A0A9X1V827_9BACL|nr:hypothetical protein [Sulfoacidibacillus ferrooxidans]
MRSTWLSILVIVIVGLGAMITNPPENKYTTWLVTQEAQREHSQLGKGLIHLVGNFVATQSTTEENYAVCTIYTTAIFGQKIVVLGAFDSFIPLHLPSSTDSNGSE